MNPIATINSIGIGVSYQDLGRHGYTRFGIAPSGAMDPTALQLANKLLDNHPNDTCLEITLGSTLITFLETTWVALTGPASSNLIPPNSARQIHAGQTLTIHPPQHGIWSYLAIPSGLQSKNHFNSHSRHERSNLGTKIESNHPLHPNSPQTNNPYPHIYTRSPHPDHLPTYTDKTILTTYTSPHKIPKNILDQFHHTHWKVSPTSDRTGYRLSGNPLPPLDPVPSLPVIPGCIQLPPNGQPIITLNDGPTVGGYPILGIVDPKQLHLLTQSQPGSTITFQPIT